MSLAEHTRIHLEQRGKLTQIGQIIVDSLNDMARAHEAGETLPNHSPSSPGFWFAGLAREHSGPGDQFSSSAPLLSETLSTSVNPQHRTTTPGRVIVPEGSRVPSRGRAAQADTWAATLLGRALLVRAALDRRRLGCFQQSDQFVSRLISGLVKPKCARANLTCRRPAGPGSYGTTHQAQVDEP